MKHLGRLVQAMIVFSFMVLTGCQIGSLPATESSTPAASTVALGGKMLGGQNPISAATIQLYAVGITGDGSSATPLIAAGSMTNGSSNNYYSNTGSTNGNYGCSYTTGNPNNCTALPVTNSVGYFQITGDWNCTSNTATYGTNPLLYMVASGGNPGAGTNANVTMMAALGFCTSLTSATNIVIDEVTTVGSVAALYPYMTSYSAIGSNGGSTTTTGDWQKLSAAFTTATKYMNIATGLAPGSALSSGSYGSSSEINSLANSVSSCVNSTGGTAGDGSMCGKLFTYATPSGGAAPTETIGALIDVLDNPGLNVTAIFNLAPSTGAPFEPTLAVAPSYWTLPIIASPPSSPLALPVAGTYTVENQTSSLYWDNNGATTSAKSIYLYPTPQATGSQNFTFTPLGGGAYQINSAYTGATAMALTNAGSASSGVVITQSSAYPGSSYNWFIASTSTGSGYIIYNNLGGLPLGESGTTGGSTVEQLTSNNGSTGQVWTITPTGGGACPATPITPEVWTSTKGWQSLSSINVPPGVEVSLAGAPTTGGSWSWSGSNSFSSSTLQNNNIPVSSGSNTYTATYTNSCGTMSTLTYTVTVGQPVLTDAPCDLLNTAGTPCAAAYSLTRRMFAAYSGNLFQVERASDSTTLDVGTSSTTGEVAASPVTTFCASTTCYVSKIYDQTTNANNLTTASTSTMALYQTSPYNGLPMLQTPAPTETVDATYPGTSQTGGSYTGTVYYQTGGATRVGGTGIPTGNSAISVYYVRGNSALLNTEGDFGDMDSAVANSGKGDRFALGYSGANGTTNGATNAAYYCVDLENTTAAPYNLTCGASESVPVGNNAIEPVSVPSPPVFTLIGKYTYNATLSSSLVTIEMADATQGTLTQVYNAAPAQAPSLGGAVVLAEGGDGKLAISSFQEGAIIPYTTTLTEDASVQSNIAAFYGSLANPVASSYSNYQGPGDIVSGASGWWGLRAYNNAYAAAGSNAVMLYRTSDLTYAIVPVTATGDLLLTGTGTTPGTTTGTAGTGWGAQTFCQNTMCNIETWYDQSGNGKNATQTTLGYQAQLLFNCIDGAKVCASFMPEASGGTPGGYSITLSANIPQPLTLNAVYAKTDPSFASCYLIGSNQSGAFTNMSVFGTTEQIDVLSLDSGSSSDLQLSHSYVFQSLTGVFNNTTSSPVYLNGISSLWNPKGSGTAQPLGTGVYFGGYAASGGGMFMGFMQEGAVWASALTATQAASLANNQRAYWGF